MPADRYCASARSFPAKLPPIEYPAGATLRNVQREGFVTFDGRRRRVPKALIGHPVCIEATQTDGVFEVRFLHHVVTEIDLREVAN